MTAPGPHDLIDVVDYVTGARVGTIERERALATGAAFRTVHVLVTDRRGRLLLQRLSERRERHSGCWGSSVAAYLHAGESDDDAARRRLTEELGLAATLAELGRLVVRDGRSHKLVQIYAAEGDAATIEEPNHIAELRWWDRSELDEAIRARPRRFTPTFTEVYKFGRSYLDRDRRE